MRIRLIASDIDDTLIPKGGKISPATRRALMDCEAAGVPVVLSSGRTFYGVRAVSREIGLNGPIISANGGRADRSPDESPIYEDRIARDLSLAVYGRLRAAGCFMTSYVGTKIYVMDETNGFGSLCCRRSEAKKPDPNVIANDEARFFAEGTVNPYKYEAYSDDAALLNALRGEFLAMGLSVSSAFSYNLEILAPGGGKGRALKAVANALGIARGEIMAFGDGTNDLTMLEYAGMGVAVGNAADELKRVADRIAPDCAADGVAKILREYGLTEAGK